MKRFASNARKALRHPVAFALAVLKQFRANQGLLLAGAVAYYALLSLVPLLILVVLALTHVFDEAQVLGAIGAYLASSVSASVYGAAGSLVLILAWVYYSAIILYFGAEFTKVYANTHGKNIIPNSYSVRITKQRI